MKTGIHRCAIVGLLALVAFASLLQDANARKIRTRLPTTKNALAEKDSISDLIYVLSEADSTPDFDSIKNLIRFYGYDKTANSSMESFFMVNGCEFKLTRLALEIVYFDLQGRQLHQRLVEFDCSLPPHQTRRKDIKSWDIQKSFYYHQSAKPRRQATPFDVAIRIKSMSLLP